MLNTEKIKLMTELSMYEQKEGEEELYINNYFRSDYISKKMIQSFFGYTFCFLLFWVIEILYSVQKILNTVHIDVIISMFYTFIAQYVIGLVIFEIITLVVYIRRYNKAEKGRNLFIVKLNRFYNKYNDGTFRGNNKC